MRLFHPPVDATRFFAKVQAAWLECPRCGTVLYFRHQPRHGPVSHPAGIWDDTTAHLKCPRCLGAYLIGLIAWPYTHAGGKRTAPRDQLPNERQLVQLRAMAVVDASGRSGAGWWMPADQAKSYRRPDDTNMTAACSCREGTENTTQQNPACAIHGTGAPPFRPVYEDPAHEYTQGEVAAQEWPKGTRFVARLPARTVHG